MKINISAVHFNLKPDVRDYAAEKVGHLEKYYKNIISADVRITCDHEDTAGSTYTLKTKIKIPGKDIFAETSCRNLFEGIDDLEGKLKEQILKTKEKTRPKRLNTAKEWVRNFLGK